MIWRGFTQLPLSPPHSALLASCEKGDSHPNQISWPRLHCSQLLKVIAGQSGTDFSSRGGKSTQYTVHVHSTRTQYTYTVHVHSTQLAPFEICGRIFCPHSSSLYISCTLLFKTADSPGEVLVVGLAA
jgi:hypothetical protein